MSTHYRTAVDVVAGIETDVRTGRLAPGARLPTVRALATRHGLAPGTVASAYRTLRERGVIETAGRRGTVVRQRPPVGVRARGGLPAAAPGVRDLSLGAPDPALLPPLPALVPPVRGYGMPAVDPRLLSLARERFTADGVPAADVAVTGGALDGIERLLTGFTTPGDRIAVEDPGWANLLDLLAAMGLVVEPMEVDDDGPLPSAVHRAVGRGVRAVLVTSRAHNPTGAALTGERAAQVAAAVPADVLLVEDDHAAEVAGVPPAGLAAARLRSAPDGLWAVVRSVSKPYGPDLRLAIVAGDPATADRVESRQRLGTGWVSGVLQNLVVALWTDPAVDALLARATAAYDRRRRAVLSALADRGLPGHGRTGVNLWVPVPDEAGTVLALREAGWAVAPGVRYRISAGPGIRVTVAGLDPAEAEPLADAIVAAARPRPATTYGA